MDHSTGKHYVFGYASLLQSSADGTPCRRQAPTLVPNLLRGFRRTWNVAMDNSVTIPGYKYYVDPVTGERPAYFVVFLNIVADRSTLVNGAVFEVSADRLTALDNRERNYDRIEVSSLLSEPVEGTVWTYVGSGAGVRRFETGRRANRAVISAAYRNAVRQGFSALGGDAAEQFERLTEPPECPIVPLQRIPAREG